MNIFVFCLFAFFSIVINPVSGLAQVQLPQFSISNIPTIEFDENMRLDNEAAFAGVNNEIMRDTLRLQYQINLLESLIRRQTEIQRIALSYEKIGISFEQPAPPKTACEQLPFNILCMAFYPESSKYKSLIDERQEESKRAYKRQMDEMMSNIDMGGFNEANLTPEQNRVVQQAREAEKPSPDTLYIWSDIQCLAGECSALLLHKDDSTLRFRVRESDELPTGGRVQSISAEGVTTTFKSKTYELFAQSIDGSQQVETAPETNQIADLLNDNLGDEAQNSTAMQQAVSDEAIAPQSVGITSGVPDVLGATGLF